MPSLNHTHTYQRIDGSKNKFRCKHPDCSHNELKKSIVGKRSRCTCGKDFILTYKLLRLKNPHCDECGLNPKPNAEANMVNLLIDVLGEQTGEMK